MTKIGKVSFVVPVFNNPSLLHEITSLTIEAVRNINAECEIIFVNDGSTDHSFSEIKKLSEEFSGIVCGIDLMRNTGQHNATLCGIKHASGDYIITMDDDLSFSPAQGTELLQFMRSNNLDLAYGLPQKNKHGLRRSLGKYLLYIGSSIGSKRIAGASFRSMTATLASQLQPEGDVIFIDDMLTSITSSYHYKLFPNFKTGIQSRYNGTSLFRMGMNILFFYSGFPLRFLTYAGLYGSVFTTMIGLFYLVKKLFFKVPIGYTSIIVAVLFSASAVLFGMGILGKYLYRIHGNRNKVQSYHIREISVKK
ncbi:Prophage bactoprenol glucosyl transferase [bioreactor metagenome]|uniref:Prophage bactoprenol glucosyl transferase n=1 Tax=bioreactor metagenome TaxID=1076179 RepID=A0A644XHA6_9ZZZZ